MKLAAQNILLFLASAAPAQAGMRHPIDNSTPEAMEIQSTPIVSGAAYRAAARILPDRIPSAAPAKAAQKSPAVPAEGPGPRAPSLPSASNIQVPGVHIPRATGGDGLLRLRPEAPSLRGGVNRAQLYSFLRSTRAMKLPSREYTPDLRAAEIARRYRDALHPSPYKSFRTAYRLGLEGVGKITEPPPAIQYENMVKRIDSLFHGLELRYPRAMMHLWELSESPTNEKALQARDALFAALISERAGWETPAYNLLATAVARGIDREDRYLQIIWGELEKIQHPVHVDSVVASINPARALAVELRGDRANFAMAKRMLLERHRAPRALNPSPEPFLARIGARALRDRFQLLASVGQLRAGTEAGHAQALATLRALEADGTSSVQQEARLALARAHLHRGSGAEAMALYKGIVKNGRNRLEVLAEQTFAEYLSGEYQESLGKSVVLQSPYFAFGFAPDVPLIEILSRKAMCDFGGAEAAIRRFREQYGRELAAVESLLAAREKEARRGFYEELIAYHALEAPLRHQRHLLQLPAVMENQKALNQALLDLEGVDGLGKKHRMMERPEGWDGFAAAMRERWGNRASELRAVSEDSALREAAYMAKRLRGTLGQLELLDLDISTGAARNYNLQSALNFPARKAAELETDADNFRWPYEDEIWEDEVDFMRSKKPSKCAVAAK